jgi:hypothetical protein
MEAMVFPFSLGSKDAETGNDCTSLLCCAGDLLQAHRR